MSADKLLGQLKDLASTVLPLVTPGGGKWVEVGKQTLDAMTTAAELFKRNGAEADPQTVAEFDAMREDLEERTRAAVHDTADRLRG